MCHQLRPHIILTGYFQKFATIVKSQKTFVIERWILSIIWRFSNKMPIKSGETKTSSCTRPHKEKTKKINLYVFSYSLSFYFFVTKEKFALHFFSNLFSISARTSSSIRLYGLHRIISTNIHALILLENSVRSLCKWKFSIKIIRTGVE